MKRMRKILVAVLCCSLALVTVAYATNATKTIQAAYRNIKLVIDGVPVTPRDSNGNVVEPFIYNGTTYLPVRAVGEALGKEVSWDGNTNTVYVGEAPGQGTCARRMKKAVISRPRPPLSWLAKHTPTVLSLVAPGIPPRLFSI